LRSTCYLPTDSPFTFWRCVIRTLPAFTVHTFTFTLLFRLHRVRVCLYVPILQPLRLLFTTRHLPRCCSFRAACVVLDYRLRCYACVTRLRYRDYVTFFDFTRWVERYLRLRVHRTLCLPGLQRYCRCRSTVIFPLRFPTLLIPFDYLHLVYMYLPLPRCRCSGFYVVPPLLFAPFPMLRFDYPARDVYVRSAVTAYGSVLVGCVPPTYPTRSATTFLHLLFLQFCYRSTFAVYVICTAVCTRTFCRLPHRYFICILLHR